MTEVRGLNLLTTLRVVKFFSCARLSKLGDVRSLQNVRVFAAVDCALRGSPIGLEELGEIRELDLSGNPKLAVAPSVRAMPSLRALKLSGCELAAMPDGFDSASSLIVVDVRINSLKHMPNLSRLTNLRWLALDQNKIESPLLGTSNPPLPPLPLL